MNRVRRRLNTVSEQPVDLFDLGILESIDSVALNGFFEIAFGIRRA